MTKIMNPYGVTIDDVVLRKFNPTSPFGMDMKTSEPLSIMPQVSEFTLYQSVFSPVLKAQLAIYDAINLLTNYPMMGEETIEVILKQKGTKYVTDDMTVSLKFIISNISGISFGKTARDQTYIIDLVSYEAFNNAKKRVSKAYRGGMIEDSIKDVITTFLKSEKDINFPIPVDDNATGVTGPEGGLEGGPYVDRVLVVPNLKPFSALTWLSKMIVPVKPEEYHNFVFYESIYEDSSRFTFKPFQLHTWRDSVGDNAFKGAENRPFFYLSNYEAIMGDAEQLKSLSEQGVEEDRLVIAMSFNKRYSVLEKIIGGYFENEYVEINMSQKVHKITRTTVKDRWKQMSYGNYLQSNSYINSIINDDDRDETSPRVAYVMFNYEQDEDPKYRERRGKQEISKIATSQIDLTVDIPPNMKIVAGDLFYLNIPNMHGYNDTDKDRYLNGHYYITENKMVIRSTGEAVMQLRINKDSYFTPIDLNKRINTE